jgi:hypothetical protein
VRTPTQVDEAAVPIDGDLVSFGDVVEAGELELLAPLREQGPRLVARQDLARELGVLGDDAAHLGLDALEILGSDALRNPKVVLELLDVIASARVDLGPRPEPLHGVGHHVLGGVPDHLARLRVAGGHDAERSTAQDRCAQVEPLVRKLAGQRARSETRSDLAGDLERSGARRDRVRGPVRKLELDLAASHFTP